MRFWGAKHSYQSFGGDPHFSPVCPPFPAEKTGQRGEGQLRDVVRRTGSGQETDEP